MGFWDFVAADHETFISFAEDNFPEFMNIGGLDVSSRVLAESAWLNPGSMAGMVFRYFYNGSEVTPEPWERTQAGVSTVIADQLRIRGGGSFEERDIGHDLTEGLQMPQIVVPNVYRATVRGQQGGQEVVNVFHFRASSGGQEQACATALQTAWKTGTNNPFSQYSPQFQLVSFNTMDLSTENGGIWEILDTTAGTNAGAMSALQTTALITWNGQSRNRRTRGRTYYGPLNETDIDADGRTLNSARRTQMGLRFDSFRASMLAAGFTLGVLSRVASTWTEVTRQYVEPIIATQRRRLR